MRIQTPICHNLRTLLLSLILTLAQESFLHAGSRLLPHKESSGPQSALHETAEAHYKKGIELYKAKKYDQAIAEFKETIKLNPHYENAYKTMVQTYKEMRDLDQAILYFKELGKTQAENTYRYFALGLLFAEKNEYQKAIANYKQSIQLLPQFAAVYTSLVKAFRATGHSDEAARFIRDLIKLRPDDPYPYYGLARTFESQAKWDAALEALETSIKLKPDMLDAYLLRISILRDTGRYEEALHTGQIALQMAERSDDADYKGRLLGDIGGVYWYMGEYQTALEKLRTSLQLSKITGNQTSESVALNTIGLIHLRMGHFQKSLTYFNQSLEIDRKRLDKKGQGYVLGNIGHAYVEMGEYERAIAYYYRTLNIAKETADKKSEAITFGAISNVHSYQGNYPEALKYAENALKIHIAMGDKRGESNILGNMGLIYIELGNYTRALEYLRRALLMARELGDKYLQELWLGNIGATYSMVGDFQKAKDYLELSLAVARTIGDKNYEGQCLANIATLHWELGDTTKSTEYLEQALAVFVQTENKRSQGITYANLAYVHAHLSKYEEAFHYIENAVAIAQEIGNRYGEGEAYNVFGTLQLKLEDYRRAIEFHEKALAIGEELKASKIIWEAKFSLGNAYQEQGSFVDALNHYKQAVDTIESVRGQLLLGEQKASFLESKIRVYEKLINLLFRLDQGRPNQRFDEEAFQYVERAKARVLLEILTEAKVEISKGIDPVLLARQEQVFRTIAKIQTHLRNKDLTETEKNELYNNLTIEEKNLESLRVALKKHQTFAELRYPEPLTLSEVQNKVLEIDDVLVEYSLGEENSYLWAITKRNSYIAELPPRKQIIEEAHKYLSLVGRPPQLGTPLARQGKKLYDMLLKPLGTALRAGADLIIIPDGILHYLPFEALICRFEDNRPRYLVESFNVSYAPSASVLSFIKTHAQKSVQQTELELLAFGDPVFGDDTGVSTRDAVEKATSPEAEFTETALYQERGFEFKRLPYTAVEVGKIAPLFPPGKRTTYLRAEAKEERLKAEALRDYRILHFATHGVLDEQTPGRSCIVLTLDDDPTEDGFLQMNEIFNLKLDAELVVLSACQTGRGKLLRGEGIIGLTRAFFYAGARTIVVSLWSVNDRSTAELMAKFYAYMQDGKTKSEALRQAKLDLIRGPVPALRHPYYWAPFVLTGSTD